MKKISMLLVLAAMSFAFVACGGAGTKTEEKTDTVPQTEEVTPQEVPAETTPEAAPVDTTATPQ
jgi:PBP1b-binding outer membrane lipoprotein LpoB